MAGNVHVKDEINNGGSNTTLTQTNVMNWKTYQDLKTCLLTIITKTPSAVAKRSGPQV